MTRATLGGVPESLSALIAEAGQQAPARPVERWDPQHCGSMDMVVKRDGTWHYMSSPVGREALVRLFASILRREPDGSYVLVTPVEKIEITVEDAPFQAVELVVEGEGVDQALTFRTNVGDIVEAGPEHPLRFATEAETGGLKPYLHVRGGLEALVTRQLAQDLAELAEVQGGRTVILSRGAAFPLDARPADASSPDA